VFSFRGQPIQSWRDLEAPPAEDMRGDGRGKTAAHYLDETNGVSVSFCTPLLQLPCLG